MAVGMAAGLLPKICPGSATQARARAQVRLVGVPGSPRFDLAMAWGLAVMTAGLAAAADPSCCRLVRPRLLAGPPPAASRRQWQRGARGGV
jgi:hypothetical protein